jgi:hypothetical protein
MVRLFRAKEQADARIVIDIVIRRLAGNGFVRGAKEPHRRGVVWFASQDHVGEPLPIYVDGI